MKEYSAYSRFLILLGILAMALFSCDTENNIEDPDLNYFVKYYGGDGNQYGVDMELLADGSLLLAGNYTQSSFDTDIFLVRVNDTGETIWETRIGQDPTTNGIWDVKDLEPTTDGNFVILADFQAESGGQRDMKLLKVSSDGAILGSVGFGTPANDFSRSVTSLSDGGFIVSGTTEFTSSFGLANVTDPDLGDFVNYRFDQNLAQLPLNTWGPISPSFSGRQDVAVKAIERIITKQDDTNDTIFQVFGHSNIDLQNTNPNKRLGLLYFQRGNTGTTSTVFFPGNFPEEVQIEYVLPLEGALGDGVVLVGTARDNFDQSKIFISSLRSSLTYTQSDAIITGKNINPNKSPGPNRNIRGVAAATSTVGELGYLILANEVRISGTNFWLSKVDQSGEPLWSTTFGSEGEDDTAGAVLELPDGKIVILGTMGLVDNQFKMALIKVNREGKLLK